MRIQLQRVQYMPKNLEPGILYLAEEFGAVAHLCPCGCGSKVSTPLGPKDWKLKETVLGPTLYPSVGNFHQQCQSHYWIRNGQIEWAIEENIEEEATSASHSEPQSLEESYQSTCSSFWQRAWRWLREKL